ncbi:RdgB/HAM1 family non-canonical purine NTP pyrophosphatase [Candidatus Epulonipiscium viviparus]|uniref:RdgB/HAM1 family non-canonical purine NTP pyrophosphatase n=1 Tax=Candidatus Epulonipiscium viviparus TaxID=420336 RepID=UPI00016BFF3B|nr:RdgB/HAM1 family non-canonical purine NTP pyrophosphatase [Candidatus Epulopiscium viviparus]
MTTIIFATTNEHKVKELQDKIKDWNVNIISMLEAGIDIDIEETGTTFEENARLKAKAVSKYTDQIVLADDSGLEVDAINKEPGIYSARYLGDATSYEDKMNDIIRRLKGAANRSARFVCAMAMYQNEKELCCVRGTIEGYIGDTIKGAEGFGYDPFFYIENGKSLGEISLEEKNKISHRANAIKIIGDRYKQLWH